MSYFVQEREGTWAHPQKQQQTWVGDDDQIKLQQQVLRRRHVGDPKRLEEALQVAIVRAVGTLPHGHFNARNATLLHALDHVVDCQKLLVLARPNRPRVRRKSQQALLVRTAEHGQFVEITLSTKRSTPLPPRKKRTRSAPQSICQGGHGGQQHRQHRHKGHQRAHRGTEQAQKTAEEDGTAPLVSISSRQPPTSRPD